MADKKTSKRFKDVQNAPEAVEFGDVFKWIVDDAKKHTATTVATHAMESMVRDAKGQQGRMNAPKAKAVTFKFRDDELRRRANIVRNKKSHFRYKVEVAREVSKQIKQDLKSADLPKEEIEFLKLCDVSIDRIRRII